MMLRVILLVAAVVFMAAILGTAIYLKRTRPEPTEEEIEEFDSHSF